MSGTPGSDAATGAVARGDLTEGAVGSGASLAEYVAIEARNLAPLPGDIDFAVGASLPISGLTAWQGLFDHGRLQAGQSVLPHGAAGAVGDPAADPSRADDSDLVPSRYQSARPSTR